MTHPAEFDRKEPYRGESLRPEATRVDFATAPEEQHVAQNGREPAGRAKGSPLPMGSGGRPLQELGTRTAPPGRSLGNSGGDDPQAQRAMGVLAQAMPFVQKLLPLIDGNMATAVANFFSHRTPAAAPSVDLTPVRSQMTELQVQQEDLRVQVLDQTSSLKRMEDRLELVREATDRNTLEQQELIEDLKAVGNKVNLFALLLFVMLIVSVALNLVLFLHIKQLLP